MTVLLEFNLSSRKISNLNLKKWKKKCD